MAARSKRITPLEHAVDEHLGARIRAARISKGWTMQRLADDLGVDGTLIIKYERGATRMSVARMLAIGRALDQPLVYFTDDAPSTAPGDPG